MQSPRQEDMHLVRLRILVVERGDSLRAKVYHAALDVWVQEVRIVLSVLEFLHDPSQSSHAPEYMEEGGRGVEDKGRCCLLANATLTD